MKVRIEVDDKFKNLNLADLLSPGSPEVHVVLLNWFESLVY